MYYKPNFWIFHNFLSSSTSKKEHSRKNKTKTKTKLKKKTKNRNKTNKTNKQIDNKNEWKNKPITFEWYIGIGIV